MLSENGIASGLELGLSAGHEEDIHALACQLHRHGLTNAIRGACDNSPLSVAL